MSSNKTVSDPPKQRPAPARLGRGGARQGAGRKSKTGQPMIVKRVPQQIVPQIDNLITQLTQAQQVQVANHASVAPTAAALHEGIGDFLALAPLLSQAQVPLASDKIPAGFPSPAQSYAEDYLDFNEYLIKNRAATIVVRSGGESMLNAGIDKNDLLVIDRSQEAKHRDIVMADLGNEYTIKRLIKKADGGVELHSENKQQCYPNFSFKDNDQLMIVGVVTYIIKDAQRR
ncbi:LexA family protein [Brackiella oedipodis]|uniref:LexA family protein n=1 Tax=Brackiella oedipodis TaxID=124225 RepID=UPI00056E64AF|nr:translesion error-prone DNA polymerase V autoproteolytic subunit [Brackiella oedipodis]